VEETAGHFAYCTAKEAPASVEDGSVEAREDRQVRRGSRSEESHFARRSDLATELERLDGFVQVRVALDTDCCRSAC